ncbi:class E sortase [Candidatus Saccharibacteria bacterium]|nr:class E sortase [Candidatus Saccharibacteria bacterium]
MDSKTGGLSYDEKQRQAAAEIARRKVLQSYEDKEVKEAAQFIKRQEKGEEPKGLEKQGSRGTLGVSATPVLRQVTNDEWKKYHTAWQEYYQNYYSQYYMNAAKEYVAKEQVKKIRADGEAQGATGVKGSAVVSSEAEAEKSFKEKIRERAMERAKKASRRRWLMPIIFGVSVVLVILFLQYNRLIFAPIAAYVSPGEQPSSEISAIDSNVTLTKVSAENRLIIPKLNVDVPINFEVGLDDVMTMMNQGVVHYRINGASAYPGEIGNFVITGHSAGDIYSSNQYKFIFSGLERLEEGDIIYVHYNQTRYTYKMVGREIIDPTEVSKLIIETDKPMLTLVTCWPLGTSKYRLLISAEQISPSYKGAEIAKDVDIEIGDMETTMPSNEKTLFERIWDWLTGK